MLTSVMSSPRLSIQLKITLQLSIVSTSPSSSKMILMDAPGSIAVDAEYCSIKKNRQFA